jgi:uncharacterized protein (TIGR02145 family)
MNKTNKYLFLLITVVSFFQNVNAQVKVGNNPTTINSSALIELESTTRGFLPPRMTTTQINTISNPANGLVVYNTTIPCLQVNIGSPSTPMWQCLMSIGSISSLNCAGATNNGTLTNGIEANGVSSVLPFTGGNGGTHTGQTVQSTGVTGLTATLLSGTFTVGSGNLTYNITGTPSGSGTATFAINIGGQSCNLTRTVSAAQASSGGTAVVSAWTSTIGCNVGAGTNNSPAGVRQGGVNQTMVQGTSASNIATITLQANVTTIGSYRLSTNTINGVQFTASGNFTSTGNNPVTLTAAGTPALAGNFLWALSQTPSINIYGSVITINAPLGNSYNNHFNGIVGGVHVGGTETSAVQNTGETFNNNTTCQNRPISAQGCNGITSVFGTSGRSYPTVDILGQCWLRLNLNDIPSVYSSYTTSSWTNVNTGDQGYWGYHHPSVFNGTSGWGSSEPATNEGLLYQWCAAMNATISERSRGICPAGFHVPSDCEWMYLEHGQGLSLTNQNTNNDWRGTTADNEGTPSYKLRSQGTNNTNTSGFSALLAGRRNSNSNYINSGTQSFRDGNGFGFWWTSTQVTATQSSDRGMEGGIRGVGRNNRGASQGNSLRCLKD